MTIDIVEINDVSHRSDRTLLYSIITAIVSHHSSYTFIQSFIPCKLYNHNTLVVHFNDMRMAQKLDSKASSTRCYDRNATFIASLVPRYHFALSSESSDVTENAREGRERIWIFNSNCICMFRDS